MSTKHAAMDKTGTYTPAIAASVDLAAPFSCQVPANGLEWVQGVRTSQGGALVTGLYLVPRRIDPWTPVDIPKDLHLTFSDLTPDPTSILNFACRYGCLTIVGTHFHPDGKSASEWGEE